METGRLDRALAALEADKALESSPELVFNLAVAFQESARLDTAERLYRTVIASGATFSDAHINLGHVLLAAGRPEEAERTVDAGKDAGIRCRVVYKSVSFNGLSLGDCLARRSSSSNFRSIRVSRVRSASSERWNACSRSAGGRSQPAYFGGEIRNRRGVHRDGMVQNRSSLEVNHQFGFAARTGYRKCFQFIARHRRIHLSRIRNRRESYEP